MLTNKQRDSLDRLEEQDGPLTIYAFDGRTLRSLVDRGFVEFCHDGSAVAITDAGREAVTSEG